MDEYLVVISDGETSQTYTCYADQIPTIIAEFLTNEMLMLASIVMVATEETYES